MKQKTPEQELELLRKNLLYERVIWEHINENGCNDPFWTDGCNMNLTRNHILSYRNEIANCCEEHNLPLPEEYFLKVPPEVDDNYMANFNQKVRVDRLKQQGDTLSRKKKKFIDDGQEIIVTDGENTWCDTCSVNSDVEYGLESCIDWIEIKAWMPLPEPYKEG